MKPRNKLKKHRLATVFAGALTAGGAFYCAGSAVEEELRAQAIEADERIDVYAALSAQPDVVDYSFPDAIGEIIRGSGIGRMGRGGGAMEP